MNMGWSSGQSHLFPFCPAPTGAARHFQKIRHIRERTAEQIATLCVHFAIIRFIISSERRNLLHRNAFHFLYPSYYDNVKAINLTIRTDLSTLTVQMLSISMKTQLGIRQALNIEKTSADYQQPMPVKSSYLL